VVEQVALVQGDALAQVLDALNFSVEARRTIPCTS